MATKPVEQIQALIEKKESLSPIQGIPPASINEWNVAQALQKLKAKFNYQYSLDGGRAVRGGQVIDFMIWTAGRPIAVYVQGSYWHNRRTSLEDSEKQSKATRKGYQVILLSEAETRTMQSAMAAVRQKVGPL